MMTVRPRVSSDEGLLDQCLVLGVGKGGGLVQHHDGRVLQDGPGQGDALLLAAGEVGPLGADLGVHALGQLFQDIPALGGHQRRQHLLPGGVRAGGPDIFQNGGLEQAAVLEHKGDLVHEHMGVDLLSRPRRPPSPRRRWRPRTGGSGWRRWSCRRRRAPPAPPSAPAPR